MSDVSCGRQTRVGSASAVAAQRRADAQLLLRRAVGEAAATPPATLVSLAGPAPWNGGDRARDVRPDGQRGELEEAGERARCAIGTSSFPDARPTTSRALETRDGEKRVGGKRAEFNARGASHRRRPGGATLARGAARHPRSTASTRVPAAGRVAVAIDIARPLAPPPYVSPRLRV